MRISDWSSDVCSSDLTASSTFVFAGSHSAAISSRKRATSAASGVSALFAAGAVTARRDIDLHRPRNPAAVDVGQLAIDLARILRLLELHQRVGEIIEAVGRALAVGHLLVIIVESDRGEAGLAFVEKIGSASCRERVCQSVSLAVVPVSLKKTN